MSSARRYPIIWIALAIYWLGLFIATHLPPRHIPPVPVSDKIEHFTGFAILAILLSIAIGRRVQPRAFAVVLAICLIYAALDEWTQPFVGRTCDLKDWLADGGGAIVGSLIGLIIIRRFPAFAAAPVER